MRRALASFSAPGPNWPERTGECAFGFDSQSFFMPGQDDGDHDDDRDNHNPYRHADGRRQFLYLSTQVIRAERIDRDPRNGAGDVCNPEIAPGHVIGAGQKADEAAEQRDEAAMKTTLLPWRMNRYWPILIRDSLK